MPNKQKAINSPPSKPVGDLALQVADHITAMLAYWDQDLVCRFANRAYLTWFGKTKEEMIDKIRLNELLGPLYEKNLPYIKAALAGEKQLFERDIPIPGGQGTRPSLATYIPDIHNGKVLGFFVHVADVTHLKALETAIAATKRETLRKIIETEENEKRRLVERLRESINQRLVACKIMLGSELKIQNDIQSLQEASNAISDVIRELNVVCEDLSPTEIDIVGLVEALDLYLAQSARRFGTTIRFFPESEHLESLTLTDKYAVFRIVQNFTALAFATGAIKKLQVSIHYSDRGMKVTFITPAKVLLDKTTEEYHTIASRIDYYNGSLNEYSTRSKYVCEIELQLNSKK